MLTFEDFPVGAVFQLGPKTVTSDEIIAFAKKFDPQPFHLDADSEQARLTGGLIASGWHTSSMLMSMMCDAYLLDSASQGSAGLDEVRWLKPVRPDDTLSGTATVLERHISRSRPELGILQMNYELRNQNDEIVMTVRGSGMVKTGAPA
mgnify:CR=1 FL=1